MPAQPILSVDEFPITDGSTACIPLIAQIMADTTGLDLETARSAVTTNTTAQAWRNLGLYGNNYGDSVKLIIAYEAPESVKEELKADGDPLEQKAIGRDALVFIVNEDNPVQSLTRQQLKDIYAGKITNWKEVGGEDLAIVPFQRGEDSGSQTLFQKLLIQGGPLMEAPTELAPTAMGELVDSIAEYNNSANAIGFSVYYYIDQMYSKPGLRLLAVDGVTPSNETIADQSYPLCNEFYAAILQDSTQPHVYLGGEQYLLDWPQLDGKVGDILTLLNDEEQAAGLIAPPAERSESVLLGEDLEPQIPGLCIVSDRYLVGGGLWGSIALIGPTRMPFQKLMPLLHTFADQLGEGMSGKRKDTPQAAAPRRTVIYKEDLE
mgnify:FL=1